MTDKEREEVAKKASSSWGMHSSSSGNGMTNGSDTLKFIGENRVNINGTTYYGSSAAKSALDKKS